MQKDYSKTCKTMLLRTLGETVWGGWPQTVLGGVVPTNRSSRWSACDARFSSRTKRSFAPLSYERGERRVHSSGGCI